MDSTLENIFVTALEGGSNYWYEIPNKEYRKIRAAIPRQEEPCLSVAILRAVMEKDVEVKVYDVENPDEMLGTLKRETIEQRIKDIDRTEYAWAWDAENEETGDADSSDVIFQYLVMGEVIFG